MAASEGARREITFCDDPDDEDDNASESSPIRSPSGRDRSASTPLCPQLPEILELKRSSSAELPDIPDFGEPLTPEKTKNTPPLSRRSPSMSPPPEVVNEMLDDIDGAVLDDAVAGKASPSPKAAKLTALPGSTGETTTNFRAMLLISSAEFFTPQARKTQRSAFNLAWMEYMVEGRQLAPSWHRANWSEREGFVTIVLERLEAVRCPINTMSHTQLLLALLHIVMNAGSPPVPVSPPGQVVATEAPPLPPLPSQECVRLLLKVGAMPCLLYHLQRSLQAIADVRRAGGKSLVMEEKLWTEVSTEPKHRPQHHHASGMLRIQSALHCLSHHTLH